METPEIKKLLIMNFVVMFLILFSLVFRNEREITEFDVQVAASASYTVGVDDGINAVYEYGKGMGWFVDTTNIYFNSVNIADSTVYKENLK